MQLLTDNRGWNLRNEVCHGLTEISQFDQMTVNRIIHALLCLGRSCPDKLTQ
ncbi:DUF4209 domain-containing protein [uncultured Rikenella sp.]|uniref:DUF4209 domain-containing protein n=1 Tax=uncultured Rikenella sp. TaxID=368003 RepID=UPI00345CBAC5